MWGQELNDEAAMEVVARLSPLVGGKWHEWEHMTEWRKKHPRSKVPFEADDLCEAEEFLHGDDEKARKKVLADEETRMTENIEDKKQYIAKFGVHEMNQYQTIRAET